MKKEKTAKIDMYYFGCTMPTQLYNDLFEYIKKDGGYKNVQELINQKMAEFNRTEKSK